MPLASAQPYTRPKRGPHFPAFLEAVWMLDEAKEKDQDQNEEQPPTEPLLLVAVVRCGSRAFSLGTCKVRTYLPLFKRQMGTYVYVVILFFFVFSKSKKGNRE